MDYNILLYLTVSMHITIINYNICVCVYYEEIVPVDWKQIVTTGKLW